MMLTFPPRAYSTKYIHELRCTIAVSERLSAAKDPQGSGQGSRVSLRKGPRLQKNTKTRFSKGPRGSGQGAPGP